jgi:DNA-directed RNA polymerase I, II, and III subunit RPABC5
MVLGNKYRFYVEEVRKKKLAKDGLEINKVLYLTKEFHEKTPEGEVLDELGLNKMCCRRHLLTHVDIE